MAPGKHKVERYRYNAPRSITSKSAAQRWGEQVRRDIEAGRPPRRAAKARQSGGQRDRTGSSGRATTPRGDDHRRVVRDLGSERTSAPCTGVDPGFPRELFGASAQRQTRQGSHWARSSSRTSGRRTSTTFAPPSPSCGPAPRTSTWASCGTAWRLLGRRAPHGAHRVAVRRGDGAPHERPHLDEEEAEVLCQARLDLPHRLVVLLGLDAGLRASEIAGLQIRDIDGDDLHVRRSVFAEKGKRLVYHTKSGRERIVPMSPRLAACVREAADLSTDEWLLHNKFGQPATRRTVTNYLYTAAKLAGIERRGPHSLRHSFATHALRAGADLKTVQELCGHASPRTTEVYLHGSKRTRRDAISKMAAHRTSLATESGTNLTQNGATRGGRDKGTANPRNYIHFKWCRARRATCA
ncbi:tyrosine-type recombinase/integrase [Nannocystis pusilla]|uniref:tyrosine-type recombinase/integrase n=1 Tax=Nannocystis pusilla TaxID=889268 RepID=UPI003B7B8023